MMRVSPGRTSLRTHRPRIPCLNHSQVHTVGFPLNCPVIGSVTVLNRNPEPVFHLQNICRLDLQTYQFRSDIPCSQSGPVNAISLSFPGYWPGKPGN